MWKPSKAIEQVKRRIIKLLLDRTDILTTDKILTTLREASDSELSSALIELRNEGVIACVDKRWYIRNRVKLDEYR
jgi:transcription initiation factor IIE alpha subunit